MTRIYYAISNNELEKFPFEVGQTYNQEWLQENFEKYFGTGLVCQDELDETTGEYTAKHFSGPAILLDALNTLPESDEPVRFTILKCEVTGNHKPVYWGIEPLNHGKELTVLNGLTFNSIHDIQPL